MTRKKLHAKMPEWLSTAVSFAIIGLLFAAYFIFYKPGATPVAPDTAVRASGGRTLSFSHALTIGDAHLSVAFAITGAEQERGLSGTRTLESGQGMLFVFTSDSIVPFWMKDMNYPIDIVWIGSDKIVTSVLPNVSPSTYPNTFSPKVPVRYVLEVSAGYAKANGITAGTAVSF